MMILILVDFQCIYCFVFCCLYEGCHITDFVTIFIIDIVLLLFLCDIHLCLPNDVDRVKLCCEHCLVSPCTLI